MNDIRYRFGETIITDKEIQSRSEISIVAAGVKSASKGICMAFDSVEAFDRWAETAELAQEVEAVRKAVEESRHYETSDSSRARRRHKVVSDRIKADLEELARESGLDVRSEELFALATVGKPPTEPPIFHSAILYQHANYGGAWFPLGYSVPDFTWVGFNDMTSSFKWSAIGTGILYEHSWYRGNQYWIFGPQGQPWIGSWFNDKASSGVIRYERGG